MGVAFPNGSNTQEQNGAMAEGEDDKLVVAGAATSFNGAASSLQRTTERLTEVADEAGGGREVRVLGGGVVQRETRVLEGAALCEERRGFLRGGAARRKTEIYERGYMFKQHTTTCVPKTDVI
ncbi:hypothetical protein SESBI_05075 [Sesbania bispinosa]|nr:hypothetical protein SESBI_05075 [Sesbania bispinosa]